MTRSTRFGGLMGSLEEAAPAEGPSTTKAVVGTEALEAPAAPDTSAPSAAEPVKDQAPAPVAAQDVPEKKTRAKVQLNTQQPEELKNAADKAAAYLSFTTGKKITTTDVVEQALRMYLDQLPDAAKGV